MCWISFADDTMLAGDMQQVAVSYLPASLNKSILNLGFSSQVLANLPD
jgi:hypothetical protein